MVLGITRRSLEVKASILEGILHVRTITSRPSASFPSCPITASIWGKIQRYSLRHADRSSCTARDTIFIVPSLA